MSAHSRSGQDRIVVAGALWRGGRLLAARRTAPPALAGGWELPGGKVEAGEAARDAIVRELREELGVEVAPVRRLPGDWPLAPSLVLQVWLVRLLAGEPEPLQDHDLLRWLTPESVFDVPWLPQDLPAVRTALAAMPAETAE